MLLQTSSEYSKYLRYTMYKEKRGNISLLLNLLTNLTYHMHAHVLDTNQKQHSIFNCMSLICYDSYLNNFKSVSCRNYYHFNFNLVKKSP